MTKRTCPNCGSDLITFDTYQFVWICGMCGTEFEQPELEDEDAEQ